MKRLGAFVLAVAAAASTAACAKQIGGPQATPQAGPPKLIWSGKSDGFEIRWTTGDITGSPLSKSVRQEVSELGLTIGDFHAITRKQNSDCDFTRATQIQSVVGPIVSIFDSDTMKCGSGMAGSGRKIIAIDLRHPAKPALLSDYFPSAGLRQLQASAARSCSSKPPNLLRRFAFNEVHGNNVSVLVSLPLECTIGSVTVTLPIPASLRKPLALAAQRKEGFLLKDQPAIAQGQTTTINYHYRTSG